MERMIGAKTAHRKNARKRASHPCPTPILPRDSRASRRAPTAAARPRCCNPRTWNSRHPFHPTGARATPPPAWHKRSSAPYKATMRNYQLVNYYDGNRRPIPTDDPTVFGLPCRFPAAPSIRPESCAQGIDQERLFDAGRTPKKFFP